MTTPQDEYAELRHLLFEAERQRISKLEQRLDSFPLRSREVAELLPSALNQSPDLEALSNALKAPVEQSVLRSMAEMPQRFARPLLTTLAPPIQKPLQARLNQLEKEQVSPLVGRMTRLETLLPRFDDLVSQLNNAEQRVAQMADSLPQAIRQASLGNTEEWTENDLTNSLKDPVQRCLRQSISEDTQVLADTLFPVMGPAIRKSINETFKGLLQDINSRLEQSAFSPKGLAWRWEAWRTGSPLQEVILRDTLVYRVEQVFLIHRHSGLLIHHLHQDDIESGDSDAVSAMLTAIQDFIHDSFSGTGDAQLERVEIGEFIVWLERGPDAVLASVIRGNAPYRYKDVMHDVLETMHARYGLLLDKFDGDNSSLLPLLTVLQKALLTEKVEKQRIFTPTMLASFAVIVLCILGVIGTWGYFRYQTQQHENKLMAYVETLRQTAGLVPISAIYQDKRLFLHGLRDPLAADPAQIALQADIQPSELVAHWTPYQDLSARFVEQRLQQQLAPPNTVQVSVRDDVLYLKGHADRGWIEQAYERAGRSAGVSRIVTDELVDNDAYWQKTEPLFETLLQRLHETAGIVVISSQREGNHRVIRGLRDPLALQPKQLASDLGLTDLVMHWQPYQDLSAEFVLQRAHAALQPPASIRLSINENAVLQVSGEADSAWLADAPLHAGAMAGLQGVDFTNAKAVDQYWLDTEAQFQTFLATLNRTPGLVVTESGRQGEQRFVRGLRDPLALAPQKIAASMQIEHLSMEWQSYQELSPEFVLQRARAWLQPPPSVEMLLQDSVLYLSGQAAAAWIAQAYDSIGKLAGVTTVNMEQLRNTDAEWQVAEPTFKRLLTLLNDTEGLVVTDSGRREQQWFIYGLRDPLATAPEALVKQLGFDQALQMRWQPYQDLSPAFVLKRAQEWLQPPSSIELSLNGTVLTARGSADTAWLTQAQASVGKIAGIQTLHTDAVTVTDSYWIDTETHFQSLLTELQHTTGLTVIESTRQGDQRVIRGLRDPLAPDPASIAAKYPDLQRLNMQWQSYQELAPEFILQRAHLRLQPPDTVQLQLQADQLLLSGTADSAWLTQAQANVSNIAGVSGADFSKVRNTDANWQAEQPRFNTLVETLKATAGLVVVNYGREGQHWMIRGLRDPQATFPSEAVTIAALPSLQQHWRPYQDLSAEFVQQRLQQQLQLPETVQVLVDAKGVAHFSGTADGAWIQHAVAATQQQAGITRVDTQKLTDRTAWQAQWQPAFAQLIEELSRTAGLVVTHYQAKPQGGWLLQGLRDTLAPDPKVIAARYLLSEQVEMHWRAYQDLSPQFLLQHAQHRLQPPAGVKLNLDEQAQVLRLSGEASAKWIQQLSLPLGIPVSLDIQQLVNIDMQRWQAAQQRLAELELLFNESVNFRDGQRNTLQQLTDTIQSLIKLGKVLNYQPHIDIIGETDGLGTRQHNQQLGLERAQQTRNWLISQGIAAANLSAMSTPNVRFGTETANYQNRRVHFRLSY